MIAFTEKTLTTTVSSKGQVTLPAEIRDRLGVKAGDRVEFYVENGETKVRPVRVADPDFFQQFVGMAPAFSSIEEINAWVSDMRGREPEEMLAEQDHAA